MPRPPARLPYHADSAALFEPIARRPWSIFLDSGRPFGRQGRFDFIAANPIATLWHDGASAWIERGGMIRPAPPHPIEPIRQLLGPVRHLAAPETPFSGGLMGYFGYDLAPALDSHLPIPQPAAPTPWPRMALGLYPWVLAVDHQSRQTRLLDSGLTPLPEAEWSRLQALFSEPKPRSSPPPLTARGPLACALDHPAYARAFQRIQRYLRDGDCYQVNLARCFRQPVRGDAWSGYAKLRERRPAPFGGFFNTPWGEILCNSPERFLQVRGDQALSCPIKGTRPRCADPAQDQALAAQLCASPKDRAENLMIVDLLRNDLGKVCRPGSVQAEAFCALESFPTVHHLVSRISGRLAGDQDALSLLAGAFPGGSITGAPKRRAMQIIAELEPDRRGIYCGSIGYLGLEGGMDLNIAIRTLAHRRGEATHWAGGGIVMDSECEQEFEETEHKARAFRELLGPRKE